MVLKLDIKAHGKKPMSWTLMLPDKWDEVAPDVYPQLAWLYMTGQNKMDEFDKTLRAFTLLAGIQGLPMVTALEADEIYDLLPSIDWVFNRLDLTKNLQPVINLKKPLLWRGQGEATFIGPADELENLRFAEFCAADTFVVNFAESQDIHQLHQLAAVLYRPIGIGDEYIPGKASFRGDRREKFNDQLLKQRTALMATLPDTVIFGIYLFYASCREQIIEQYPVTFPNSLLRRGQGEVKSQADTSSWLDIYDDLRADPKYAGPDRLDEELLHSVLFSLERSNIKMNELKAKYDL